MALAEKKRLEEEEEKAELEAMKQAEEQESQLRNLPSMTSFYDEESKD